MKFFNQLVIMASLLTATSLLNAATKKRDFVSAVSKDAALTGAGENQSVTGEELALFTDKRVYDELLREFGEAVAPDVSVDEMKWVEGGCVASIADGGFSSEDELFLAIGVKKKFFGPVIGYSHSVRFNIWRGDRIFDKNFRFEISESLYANKKTDYPVAELIDNSRLIKVAETGPNNIFDLAYDTAHLSLKQSATGSYYLKGSFFSRSELIKSDLYCIFHREARFPEDELN